MESPGTRAQIPLAVADDDANEAITSAEEDEETLDVFFGPRTDVEACRLKALELELELAEQTARAEATQSTDGTPYISSEAEAEKTSPSNAGPTELTDASLSRALNVAHETGLMPSPGVSL